MESNWKQYTNLTHYRRVLQVATTPTREDFMKVLTVTAGGITLMGVLGYLIYAIVFLLPGGV